MTMDLYCLLRYQSHQISLSHAIPKRLTRAEYSDDAFFVYQYDVVGNGQAMTTTAGVVTYTYDAANRLTDANGGPYT
jgi:hypothetical protein